MNVMTILKYSLFPLHYGVKSHDLSLVINERDVHEYMCDVFKGALGIEEIDGDHIKYNENSLKRLRTRWLYAFETNMKYDPITLLKVLHAL